MTRSELIDALAHRFPKQMKADRKAPACIDCQRYYINA